MSNDYNHLTFYSAQRLDLFARCVGLSRLLVGFRTHFKSSHFHSYGPRLKYNDDDDDDDLISG